MTDKGFGKFIKVLFGIGGIIILVIAWTRAMAIPDRILLSFIGLIGVSLALSAAIPFKLVLAKIGVIRNMPQIHHREKLH